MGSVNVMVTTKTFICKQLETLPPIVSEWQRCKEPEWKGSRIWPLFQVRFVVTIPLGDRQVVIYPRIDLSPDAAK
jgi:hypothetical protein